MDTEDVLEEVDGLLWYDEFAPYDDVLVGWNAGGAVVRVVPCFEGQQVLPPIEIPVVPNEDGTGLLPVTREVGWVNETGQSLQIDDFVVKVLMDNRQHRAHLDLHLGSNWHVVLLNHESIDLQFDTRLPVVYFSSTW